MPRTIASLAFLALLAACASSQPATITPSGTTSAAQGISRASGSCCNIFWNKTRLNLRYGAKPQKAKLTYWAPNGYYFYPVYCKNGSQISVTTGRTRGNPSAYEYVMVRFSAESPAPDRCALTAALNETGSPPLAVIELNVR